MIGPISCGQIWVISMFLLHPIQKRKDIRTCRYQNEFLKGRILNINVFYSSYFKWWVAILEVILHNTDNCLNGHFVQAHHILSAHSMAEAMAKNFESL